MKPNEKTTVVQFEGDLGLAEASAFVANLPEPSRVDRVVLNFSKVQSIDSTIIAALMTYRAQFVLQGGNALDIIVIANPQVERLLEITGVSRAVTVLPASDLQKRY